MLNGKIIREGQLDLVNLIEQEGYSFINEWYKSFIYKN
jgi:Fe-S cluster assembly ATPase SufC